MRLTVPIMNHSVTPDTRDEYLRQIKTCGADRVLLALDRIIELSPAAWAEMRRTLTENIQFFRDNGLACGVWVGSTIGHGVVLAHDETEGEKKDYTPVVTTQKGALEGTHCPLDAALTADLAKAMRELAEVRPDMIQLDDDFRLSNRGGEQNVGCVCPLHMARIRELCGEDVEAEAFADLALKGKPNRYRDALVQANGESLRALAQTLRDAVDEVDAGIPLVLCSTTCWEWDGVTPLELTEILAGEGNPKVLRLCGAPYWGVRRSTSKVPCFGLEQARSLSYLAKGCGIELMSEGDVYPRPCYYISASSLSLFDAALRADGVYDTAFKYMFDYVAPPTYEMGYVDRHLHDLPLLEAIEHAFAFGRAAGIRVLMSGDTVRRSDYALAPVWVSTVNPLAGILLGNLSLPTAYEGKGVGCAVFGEHARTVDPEAIRDGAILDAVAASILTERGVDVGLASSALPSKPLALSMMEQTRSGARALLYACRSVIRTAELSPSAEAVLSVQADGRRYPFAYRYENASGARFFVLMAHVPETDGTYSALFKTYLLADECRQAAEWIGRRPLPAVCAGHPELYVLCKQDETRLAVGLFNYGADAVLSPVITLDGVYARAEGIGCACRIEGNRVLLDAPLPAGEFAAVVLYK